jgi:hypothetical protein
MPTTSVRRPISRLKRSSGLVDLELAPVVGRERVEGEDFLLGLLEQRRDLAHPALKLGDGGGEPVARLLSGGGVEDRADQRREHAVLVAAGMAQEVSQEVHGSALPRCAEHLRQRGHPGWASEIASCTPTGPRATRPAVLCGAAHDPRCPDRGLCRCEACAA